MWSRNRFCISCNPFVIVNDIKNKIVEINLCSCKRLHVFYRPSSGTVSCAAGSCQYKFSGGELGRCTYCRRLPAAAAEIWNSSSNSSLFPQRHSHFLAALQLAQEPGPGRRGPCLSERARHRGHPHTPGALTDHVHAWEPARCSLTTWSR